MDANRQSAIEAAIGQRVEVLHELPHRLACFRLLEPRTPSRYLRWFLGEVDLPDRELSDQQRRALESNLSGLGKKLDAAVAGMQKHAILGSSLASRSDFLHFNLDHHCRPTCLYTAGGEVVSVVRRQGHAEVSYHGSLCLFPKFFTDFHWPDALISAGATSVVDDQAAEEQLVQKSLIQSITMRKGNATEQVILLPTYEGTDVVFRHRTIPLFRFGNREEHFRILNEFCPDGFLPEVCATCAHFRFSGLTRDWSNGSAGYCTSENRHRTGRRYVSVQDSCEFYQLEPNRNRYLQRVVDVAR